MAVRLGILQEIRDLERRLAESERRNDRLEAGPMHHWAVAGGYPNGLMVM